MLKLIRISGNSLYPEFKKGDFVLVSKIPFLFGRVRPGDVVAFRHPDYDLMIKKVEAISADGDEFTVVGSHLASTDSRHFGPVKKGQMVGKVWLHAQAGKND